MSWKTKYTIVKGHNVVYIRANDETGEEGYLELYDLYNEHMLAKILETCPRSELYVCVNKYERFSASIAAGSQDYVGSIRKDRSHIAKIDMADGIAKIRVPLRMVGLKTFDATTDFVSADFDETEIVDYVRGTFTRPALTLYIEVMGRSVDRAMGF